MKFVFSQLRVGPKSVRTEPVSNDNSSFTVLNRESNDLWEWKTFVSSAKRIKNKVEDTFSTQTQLKNYLLQQEINNIITSYKMNNNEILFNRSQGKANSLYKT